METSCAVSFDKDEYIELIRDHINSAVVTVAVNTIFNFSETFCCALLQNSLNYLTNVIYECDDVMMILRIFFI